MSPAANGQAARVDEREAAAAVAGWFGRLLLAPLDAATIEIHRNDTLHRFLLDLGSALGRPAAAEALSRFLREPSAEHAAARMGHRFVRLFEGVAGPDVIPLYESAHTGDGSSLYRAPFVEMQAILRELDVAVADTCREPPDHLGLELAALAEALAQQKPALADQLAARLRGWVPNIARALAARHDTGPYSELVTLLDAFLSYLPPAATMHGAPGERPSF
ncbi:TorD/DmsD family molecular chaperone [Burkholderia glumae]|uniref:Molecular chaperone TorD family protein n=2 Tax=Burkholderia glumae TaxID=337 RepID=A0AAP9Y087_BURGL|nr:molecular chaperone TorD family protein [Burkholderia glumae]ACR30662.1 cytoplasmic chaperone TorD family protein [Burkholderia glumae BGR1]AJY63248.1 nitrate reductase delta subunit [Burkholderia glumae LMG 2196 = ATCC 33617]PNL04994.1 cytoplasmic chaperone TorD family protein [Burkholderia glumae]QPQ90887.1 molecular chaperone TorD family protein [Burkholderia glumae]QQM94717.1 molecular chaperone TorD family protein [Burkholderia glumae]